MKHTKSRLWAFVLLTLSMVLPSAAWADGEHQLTVKAKPTMAGTFNTSAATLAAGETIHLYAYANSSFTFVQWTDETGTVVSGQPDFTYTMPAHDVQLTAEYEYNPANPANPARNYWNQQLGEVIVDDFTTGQLQTAVRNAIDGSANSEVMMITVAGVINSNDFGIINNYSNCTLLDLSRVSGVTQVPSYAFDYTNLESVYLPASIESIGYRAFYQCQQLSSLIVYAMTPPALDSYVFTDVPEGLIVYVPAAAIAQYQEADGWKNLTILPIQEDIRSISISLPEGANAADYAKMWLELTNVKSGQRMHYVMTDRQTYTFANIIRNTSWNITLRNERGDVFGQIDNVEVKDEDVSVTFSSLSKPQTVALSVLTPEGQDVTAQTQVTWTDASGNYLAQGTSLSGLPVGCQASYRVVLPQTLAMIYLTPQQVDYVLTDGDNNITCQLTAIPQVKISGKVKDVASGLPISGATISASQTFGGKYSKTLNAKTDGNGVFTLDIANVPTSVAFAASDYISQTISLDNELNELNELEDVLLKSITGATISLGFTYTTCDGETQNWYSDYQNVSYELFNVTQGKAISQYNVQYPQIVLLEEIADGDVLRLTATSRTNAFIPVTATATIADQMASATFGIVELGKIQSSFTSTDNAAVVGSLYDADGKLLKTYNYANASLTISDLADGNYTLVSMGSSRLFNTIYDLSQLPQTGLVEDQDYVQNSVEVKSGQVTAINISEVPTLDESKLYYTGDNTSFTVNKPSIVAGNYLTLTGRIDFKPTYATSVSNVQMIVDLPESCEFVKNSVMVGNSTSGYTLNGHQLTIPMTRYTDRVRFCIIPTLGGEYAPSAFAQFDLYGETVTQPIGSANYTAKDLSISVPSTMAKTTIPVSGTAIGTSNIEIYDNGVLIGQTTSMANGTWATTCELNDPYNLSRHQIYAKVTTKQGIELTSENVSCVYDMNAIQVSVVKMYHDNPELHKTYELTFDFLNPSNKEENYIYYIYNKKFTFTIDFTNNDTTKVSNVILYVKTAKSGWHPLEATYDAKQDKWVAAGEFGNMYDGDLPVNVSVDYEVSYRSKTDVTESFDAEVELIDGLTRNAISLGDNLQFELIEDQDSLTVFNVKIPDSGISGIYRIQILNYENAKELLSQKQFDFEGSENGYRYLLSESNENEESLTLIDTGEEVAYLFSFSDEKSSNSRSTAVPRRAKSDFLKWSANIKYLKGLFTNGDWIGALATGRSGVLSFLGLDKYCSAPSFSQYFDIMDSYMSEMESKGDIMTNALTKKCADGSYRLSDSDRKKYGDQIMGYDNNIGLIYNTFVSYTELYKSKLASSAAIDIFMALGTAGLSELGSLAAKGITNSGRILTNSKNTKYFKRWITNPTVRGYLENALGVGFGVLIDNISNIVNPEEADFQGVENEMNQWMVDQRNNMEDLYRTILSNIQNSYKKCKTPNPNLNPNPGNNGNGGGHPSNNHDKKFGIDPSGYVYEGVFSNRVEGAMATVFYKEMVEDMYGDLHENIVKWDAEEYAQENPLFTDENGFYRWDVPQGLWQVKFEKEGYETTYSEWLPVPPPQLDVNIAMKQNVQPNVKAARAYEDAVEVEFDKYMMPELLNAENIMVIAPSNSPEGGEKAVEGTIELLNKEVAYDGSSESFASKIRFNALEPFDATEVKLLVSNRVKSYAGIRMQDDYQQTFTIEQEIKQIVCDSLIDVGYGDTKAYVISVIPASAAKGKLLNVKTSSPMILSVGSEKVTIGDDGKAEITMTGELPGTAALTFSIEDLDKTGLTIVSVEQNVNKTVATPTASIASGTVVEKGTEITLSCTTEGAIIYYTLDGSCPCNDTDARKVYDGTPIVINENTTIKAMAIVQGMDESDVATFVYKVAGVSVVLNENSTTLPMQVTGVNASVIRTINANVWSTICLPFAMSKSQVWTAFGNDVLLKDFDGCTTERNKNGDIVAIQVNFKDAQSLEANHPYLIRVSANISEFTVDGVDIVIKENPRIDKDGIMAGDLWTYNSFVGNYDSEAIVPENCLFVNGGKLYYSKGLSRLRGYRGYFDFYDMLKDMDEASARITFSFDGLPLKLDMPIADQSCGDRVYDLSGRRVSRTVKGVYVTNKKKIVVK